MSEDDGFLSRWSRRKAQVRNGEAAPVAPTSRTAPPAGRVGPPGAASSQPAPVLVEPPTPTSAVGAVEPPPGKPAPTLDDVALLTRDSDYAPFVARGVGTDVKNAALKKLFSDPHFNVMDGLDTYIDDYGKPDPIPLAMLRQMTQTRFLGLFTEEDDEAAKAAADAHLNASAARSTATAATSAPETLPEALPDENPDLRLQPHDVAGRPGPESGAGEDSGRQS